jgi:hypothetical protein
MPIAKSQVIYDALVGHAALTAIVGADNIYHGRAASGTNDTRVQYHVDIATPENALDDATSLVRHRVRLDVYSDDFPQCETIGVEVVNALKDMGNVEFSEEVYDPDSRQPRLIIVMLLFVRRT